MSGSASSNILQEFLVAVRYQESGREKLVKDLDGAMKAIVKFAAAVEAAAGTAIYAIAKIAAQFEGLYFASQRTGASVENIKAFSFAIAQMGGSAEGARSALEGLGRFLRSNPGSESFLNSLGVSTRAAGGKLRDTSEMMNDLAARWKRMPFWQAQAEGSVLGIDENTLQALIRGTGQLGDELKKMYHAAGIDSQQAASASHGFMVQLRTTTAALDVLREKVMINLAGKVGDLLGNFRRSLVANFGDISNAITWVTSRLLDMAEGIARLVVRGIELGGKLVHSFNSLDSSTKAVTLTIGAFVAGAALLSSPTLAIIALAGAILLLFDDYSTWKEGGVSFIDWSKWEPSIKAARAGILAIKDGLLDLIREALGPAGKGPEAEGLLKFFQEKLPGAIRFTVEMITKHLFPALKALIHIGDAMGKGDWHGMLKGAAELNAAIGIQPNDTPPTAEERADGEQEGSTVLGRAWRKYVTPLWSGVKTRDGQANPAAGKPADPEAAQKAYDFWRGKGLDHDGATAMVTQMLAESGGNAAQRGDGGAAHGLFQHHGDRRAKILSRTGLNMSTGTFDEQLEGMYREMHDGLDAGAAEAWKILNDPNATRQQKVDAGTLLLERPKNDGNADVEKRRVINSGLSGLRRSPVTAPAAPVTPVPATGGGHFDGVSPNSVLPMSSSRTITNSPQFAQSVTIHVAGGADVAEQVNTGLRSANQNAIRNLASAIS